MRGPGDSCSGCVSSFLVVLPQEGESALTSAQGLESVRLWSEERLTVLATTLLRDYGRFRSFSLDTGCANTGKTEMARLVLAHCLQGCSESCEGSGLCGQASPLGMPLEMFKALKPNQNGWSSFPAAASPGRSFPLEYRDWFLFLFPCHQLCFPRRWRSSGWYTMHYPLIYFLCSVVHVSSKCFHFPPRKNGAGSSVNVTCILVGHFWFINECNIESAGYWKESMVFLFKAQQKRYNACECILVA